MEEGKEGWVGSFLLPPWGEGGAGGKGEGREREDAGCMVRTCQSLRCLSLAQMSDHVSLIAPAGRHTVKRTRDDSGTTARWWRVGGGGGRRKSRKKKSDGGGGIRVLSTVPAEVWNAEPRPARDTRPGGFPTEDNFIICWLCLCLFFSFSLSVTTASMTCCYRVSAGTGWPGVSMQWLGEMDSLICNFYLSVVARKIVWADPSLRYTSMLLGR